MYGDDVWLSVSFLERRCEMSVKRVLTIGGCVLCVVLWGLAAAWYSDGASARCLSQREASAMYGGADFPTCNVDLHWIPCSDRWGYCYGAQSSAECTSRPFCVYCSASDETNFNVGPPSRRVRADAC
jgi:hypothetical protein